MTYNIGLIAILPNRSSKYIVVVKAVGVHRTNIHIDNNSFYRFLTFEGPQNGHFSCKLNTYLVPISIHTVEKTLTLNCNDRLVVPQIVSERDVTPFTSIT